MMNRRICALLVGLAGLLLGASLCFAQTPQEEAEFWKKYGGMPPLDIRVSIDGSPVRGLFEAALARKQGQGRMPLKDRLIPVVVGQTLAFKVEVSQRGANQWTDVTRHKNLSIDAPAGEIAVDRATAQLRIRATTVKPNVPSLGTATLIVYYAASSDPKEEQFAYTHIYFDIKAKP